MSCGLPCRTKAATRFRFAHCSDHAWWFIDQNRGVRCWTRARSFRIAQVKLRELLSRLTHAANATPGCMPIAAKEKPAPSQARVSIKSCRAAVAGRSATSRHQPVRRRKAAGLPWTWFRWCTPAMHRRAAGTPRPSTRRPRSSATPMPRPLRRQAWAT